MKRGFGVDLVVANLAKGLTEHQIPVIIGCLDMDSHYSDLNILRIPPIPFLIRQIARKHSIKTIIAHTSPYFEILPELASEFKVYAWEYGDPTPELRKDQRYFRDMKLNKLKNVYPNVHDVIAISKFVAKDISWPRAKVVYLGCDHVHDLGPKKNNHFTHRRKIKIGALMRLGKGEAEYKGNHLLIELFRELIGKVDAEFHLMGRGTIESALPLQQIGFKIHLNATDDERDRYLRDLDIFISFSLWEGFNLPLVEAQAAGTMAIAFSIGAHPEVCPFVAKDVSDVVKLVIKNFRSRELLAKNSLKSYLFVRKKFKWLDAVEYIMEHFCNEETREKKVIELGFFTKCICFLMAAYTVIRLNGIRTILRQFITRYILKRFSAS